MKTSVISGITGSASAAGTFRPGIAPSTVDTQTTASIFRSQVAKETRYDDQIPQQDQVLLEWKDIEFYVPYKKARVEINKEELKSSLLMENVDEK